MNMFLQKVSHTHRLLTICFGSLFVTVTATAQDTVPVPESIRAMVSTSAQGLTQEYALSGRVVRLQGRFRSLTTATLDESAQPIVKCQGPFHNHPSKE